MKIYKIRDKNIGLYTMGGRYATSSFNKNGKIWFSIKTVNAFLKYFARDQKASIESDIVRENFYLKKNKLDLKIIEDKDLLSYIPDSWEIVEFNIKENKFFSAKEQMKE